MVAPPGSAGPDGGTIAGDLMTAHAVTIGPDESVVAAARLMERRKIKRLPVTGPDARLEGIVSRCDLVRVFLRHLRAGTFASGAARPQRGHYERRGS